MDTSKIWLIADTHFCHANIIKYCDRPFSSVADMDDIMILNWNDRVNDNDRVFVLGDFCLAGKDKIIEIGQQLNGRKTLIMGNHDSASLKTYYEAGFEIVSKHPIIIEDFIILSHKPMFTPPNSVYFNIYGHVHNDINYKDFTESSCCVSVERIGYNPISLETIRKKVGEIANSELNRGNGVVLKKIPFDSTIYSPKELMEKHKESEEE